MFWVVSLVHAWKPVRGHLRICKHLLCMDTNVYEGTAYFKLYPIHEYKFIRKDLMPLTNYARVQFHTEDAAYCATTSYEQMQIYMRKLRICEN